MRASWSPERPRFLSMFVCFLIWTVPSACGGIAIYEDEEGRGDPDELPGEDEARVPGDLCEPLVRSAQLRTGCGMGRWLTTCVNHAAFPECWAAAQPYWECMTANASADECSPHLTACSAEHTALGSAGCFDLY